MGRPMAVSMVPVTMSMSASGGINGGNGGAVGINASAQRSGMYNLQHKTGRLDPNYSKIIEILKSCQETSKKPI